LVGQGVEEKGSPILRGKNFARTEQKQSKRGARSILHRQETNNANESGGFESVRKNPRIAGKVLTRARLQAQPAFSVFNCANRELLTIAVGGRPKERRGKENKKRNITRCGTQIEGCS